MKGYWKLNQFYAEEVKSIASQLHLPEFIVRALINRGYTTPQKIIEFLFPKLSYLQDPSGSSSFERSVERVIKAIKKQERIGIYGDYDVDGITATAILVQTLKKLDVKGNIWLANRFGEGYGFNITTVEKIKKKGLSLVILVDCGTSDYIPVQKAKNYGIDVIIIDHHEPTKQLPLTPYFINPKVTSEISIDKELVSAGLSFYFVALLKSRLSISSYDPKEFLEYAALGTVADMAPLTGPNRIIVKKGIERLLDTDKLGLKELIAVVKLRDTLQLNVSDISYLLAPSLNAPGRLGNAMLALKLLLTEEPTQAKELATKVSSITSERREIENRIFEEAQNQVESQINRFKSIVISSQNWHYGVVSIVATKLCNIFKRPVIVLSEEKSGICRGSARVPKGFNIIEILKRCNDCLIKFGGHETAAGVVLSKEMLPKFHNRLENIIEELGYTINDEEKCINIDSKVDIKDIDINAAHIVEKFEPTGIGNPEPLFLLENGIIKATKLIKDAHTKLVLGDNKGNYIEVFAPNEKELATLPLNIPINVVGTIRINRYEGYENVELFLKDWEKAK